VAVTEWAPATEAEGAMRDALRADDQELYFRILARVDLLLPISSEAIAGRVPMGWGTWTAGDRTHVLAFTSSEAMHACLSDHAGSARKIPYYELAAAWPNLEWWLAVNPGLPIEGYLPAWFVSQLARGDVRLPGRTSGRARLTRADSLGRAESLRRRGLRGEGLRGEGGLADAAGRARVPVPPQSRSGMLLDASSSQPAAPAAAGPSPPTPPSPPATALPAGRPASPPSALPPSAETPSSLDRPEPPEPPGPAEPPEPAVEPVAAPPAEPVVRPAEPAPQTRPAPEPDPLAGFEPANDLEAQLAEAASLGSPDTFLSILLLAKVLLPVADGADPSVRPGTQGYLWRTEKMDEQQSVVVFTSPERLDAHMDGPVEVIGIRFVQLIRAWPDPSWSLAVNPGTPIGATLPGSQVAGLVSSAAEVGLDDDAGEAGEFAAGAAGAGAVETEAPVPMQKVVAPSQVGWYVDRGYDRVSGFVHRAREVAHLRAPAEVVAALGLRYEGSPFDTDTELDEVYVLRWLAYCPYLYRIPYGGRTEAAMAAMEGWVIERAPFRGNGFAPAESDDVIAEFKVDSVRLPHGAELWRLSREGDSRLVARLDWDGPSWQRVGGTGSQ
jgi:hypothetical protein